MMSESTKGSTKISETKKSVVKTPKEINQFDIKSNVLKTMTVDRAPLIFFKIRDDGVELYVTKDALEVGGNKIRFVSNKVKEEIYGTYSKKTGISKLTDEECEFLERRGQKFTKESEKKEEQSSESNDVSNSVHNSNSAESNEDSSEASDGSKSD